MKVSKTRILGSSYVGLFAITNNKLCITARGTDPKTKKGIEEALDVKVVEAGLYDSNLLAVFAKMNNKSAYVPSYALGREVEAIEKEIKVTVVQTEQALGNLIEVNDTYAIVSNTLKQNAIDSIKDSGLEILQQNIAETDAIGSSLLLLNNSFVVNPNASEEEVKNIQETLNIKGGASTANTGDAFVRNSVLANEIGFVVGDQTTGHELNRIEEALEG